MQVILRDRRRIGPLSCAALWLLFLMGMVIFIDNLLRPMVTTMAAYQAKVYATEAINNAVAGYMQVWETKGGRLVEVTYGGNGEVSTIQTDAVALNNLKTGITRAVTEEITRLEEQTMKIPIGTLLGGQAFSGRGPKATFKIIPAGYVQTDTINRFDSAGINQTRHQIYIEISVSIIAILPGYVSLAEVSTAICVAETVIIGSVPDTFAEFSLSDSSGAPSLAGSGA